MILTEVSLLQLANTNSSVLGLNWSLVTVSWWPLVFLSMTLMVLQEVSRDQVSRLGDVTWDQLRGGRGRGRMMRSEGNKMSLQLFLPCRPGATSINNNISGAAFGQFRNYKKRTQQ